MAANVSIRSSKSLGACGLFILRLAAIAAAGALGFFAGSAHGHFGQAVDGVLGVLAASALCFSMGSGDRIPGSSVDDGNLGAAALGAALAAWAASFASAGMDPAFFALASICGAAPGAALAVWANESVVQPALSLRRYVSGAAGSESAADPASSAAAPLSSGHPERPIGVSPVAADALVGSDPFPRALGSGAAGEAGPASTR